jgi:hypothetical protein
MCFRSKPYSDDQKDERGNTDPRLTVQWPPELAVQRDRNLTEGSLFVHGIPISDGDDRVDRLRPAAGSYLAVSTLLPRYDECWWDDRSKQTEASSLLSRVKSTVSYSCL